MVKDIILRSNGICQGSVKARDYRPELTAIVETFERLGTFARKGLTLAIGVDAAQYQSWKESLEGDGPIHPNRKTRDSIGSLMETARDYRLDGIEWALSQANSAARDLGLAADVRRELRVRLLAQKDGVTLPEAEVELADALETEVGGRQEEKDRADGR